MSRSTPSERSLGRKVFYQTVGLFFKGVFGVFGRSHTLHPERSELNGPWILAANHISHFDPPLIAITARRQIDFMAMEELFRNAVLGWLFDKVGAFPVDRFGVDSKAFRVALRRLRAGHVVGVFVEGGLRAGDTSVLNGAPARPGASALSVMAKAPILPCAIIGAERYYAPSNWRKFRHTPVWIAFGKPIAPADTSDRKAAVSQSQSALATALRSLKDEMVTQFQLTHDDLPHSPQYRKGEETNR